MSGTLMILVGTVLALSGVWSIRVAVVAAAMGSSWLLADAFGASTATGILVAAAGGVLGLLIAVLSARILFFAMGALVGAVVGARLFVLLDRGDASVVLAVIFVPAVAGCGAALAGRWRQRFLGWGTAVGGAALVLSGFGRVAPDAFGFLTDSEKPALQTLSVVIWVLLAVAARWGQHRLQGTKAPAPSG